MFVTLYTQEQSSNIQSYKHVCTVIVNNNYSLTHGTTVPSLVPRWERGFNCLCTS